MRTLLTAITITLASGLAACAAAPPATAHVDASEGYALSFPAKVETRIGREGSIVFRVDAARTADGARFEAAWFGLPEPLDAPGRADLLARVERGLAREEGTVVVSRTEVRVGSHDAVELVLDRADGRRGLHRVLYASSTAMLQVSAVGPQGGDWESEVPRFWGSLILASDAAAAGPPAPPARR